MDIDLLPNDGPVHDVTAGVEFSEGVLWQATYTGLARYDGRLWSSYYKEDSGLASNFVNFVRGRGRQIWAATDDGLSVTDSDYWVTYRAQPDGSTKIFFTQGARTVKEDSVRSSFPHNFILGVDLREDEIWLATENGVSRGIQVSEWYPSQGDS
jgi:ligand-binding sensor domain-containing protein